MPEGIRVLGEAISRKQTSLLALMSIVEVKVETALISEEPSGNGYLIALLCFVALCACAALVAFFLYARQRRRAALGLSGMSLSPSTDTCHRHHEDEKNNLQNEENLRRYANPLKDEGGAGMASAHSASSIAGGAATSTSASLAAVVVATGNATNTNGATNNGAMTTCAVIDMQKRPLALEGSEMLEMMGEGSDGDSLHHHHQHGHSHSNHHNHHHLHVPDGLKPVHRSSQIMLYKAQDPDVRKNTAAFDDATAHKDFSKTVINVNKRPSSTLPNASSASSGMQQQQQQQQTSNQQPNDVLTVLV